MVLLGCSVVMQKKKKKPMNMILGSQDKSELNKAVGIICTKVIRMIRDRLVNKIA